jgi:hypothetical protein
MIPIAPGIIVALLLSMRNGTSGQNSNRFFGAVWVLAPAAILWAALTWSNHPLLSSLLISFCLVALVPWPLAQLSARAGWQRLTVALVALADFTWGADRQGAMAWAALWVARRTDKAQHWAHARARIAGLTTIRGAGALALSLQADRDDSNTAQAMMRLTLRFDPARTPRLARRIALQWWSTELAATGQWRELADTDPEGSITARLLVGCARRLRGDSRAPSDRTLRAWWWLAGQRLITKPLLDRALINQRVNDGDKVRDVVAGWDAVVDATVSRLRPQFERVHHDRDATATVLASLYQRLGPLLLDHDWGEVREDDPRRVLVAALDHHRQKLLDQTELLASNWRARLALSDRSRSPSAELIDLAGAWHLVVQLNRLMLSGRQLAHDSLDGVLCDLAADLWNHRSEKPLANAMFRLLLEQAVLVGDERSAALQRANIACGS